MSICGINEHLVQIQGCSIGQNDNFVPLVFDIRFSVPKPLKPVREFDKLFLWHDHSSFFAYYEKFFSDSSVTPRISLASLMVRSLAFSKLSPSKSSISISIKNIGVPSKQRTLPLMKILSSVSTSSIIQRMFTPFL